jgi:hypothetical protein
LPSVGEGSDPTCFGVRATKYSAAFPIFPIHPS